MRIISYNFGTESNRCYDSLCIQDIRYEKLLENILGYDADIIFLHEIDEEISMESKVIEGYTCHKDSFQTLNRPHGSIVLIRNSLNYKIIKVPLTESVMSRYLLIVEVNNIIYASCHIESNTISEKTRQAQAKQIWKYCYGKQYVLIGNFNTEREFSPFTSYRECMTALPTYFPDRLKLLSFDDSAILNNNEIVVYDERCKLSNKSKYYNRVFVSDKIWPVLEIIPSEIIEPGIWTSTNDGLCITCPMIVDNTLSYSYSYFELFEKLFYFW